MYSSWGRIRDRPEPQDQIDLSSEENSHEGPEQIIGSRSGSSVSDRRVTGQRRLDPGSGYLTEKMLFSPTPRQIELEERGRVTIDDGLTEIHIAHTMDTQLDRIESMMFVRTIVTDSRGAVLRDTVTNEVLVADDGY